MPDFWKFCMCQLSPSQLSSCLPLDLKCSAHLRFPTSEKCPQGDKSRWSCVSWHMLHEALFCCFSAIISCRLSSLIAFTLQECRICFYSSEWDSCVSNFQSSRDSHFTWAIIERWTFLPLSTFEEGSCIESIRGQANKLKLRLESKS